MKIAKCAFGAVLAFCFLCAGLESTAWAGDVIVRCFTNANGTCDINNATFRPGVQATMKKGSTTLVEYTRCDTSPFPEDWGTAKFLGLASGTWTLTLPHGTSSCWVWTSMNMYLNDFLTVDCDIYDINGTLSVPVGTTGNTTLIQVFGCSNVSGQCDTEFGASMSGQVKDESGNPLPSFTVQLYSGTVLTPLPCMASQTTIPGTNGHWAATVKCGWVGTVSILSPCRSYATWNVTTPIRGSANYHDFLSPTIAGQTQIAATVSYENGTLFDQPVTVKVSGRPNQNFPNGQLSVTVDCTWSGTLTPVAPGYVMQPEYVTITDPRTQQGPYTFTALPAFHGIISTNTTWSARTVLDGDVQVADGITLTVAPGVEVLCASTSVQELGLSNGKVDITVRGHLQVNGSSTQPVTFHSVSGNEGDWFGIVVNPGTSYAQWATLSNSQFGYSLDTNGSVTLDRCTFSGNASRDIAIGGSPSLAMIKNCTLTVASGNGIEVQSGTPTSSIAIRYCGIYGNAQSSDGIYVYNSNAAPDLASNVINGFSNGNAVHLGGGASVLRGNSIQSSRVGIYITGGQATIGTLSNGNQITSNEKGIYAQCTENGNCPSACVLSAVVRYNDILYNAYGVVTEKTAAVDLGRSGNGGADFGNNSFYGNSTYCVWNNSSCGIVSAIGNFWNTNGNPCPQPTCKYPHPNDNQFVDTSSPLCSAPSGGGCHACPAMPAPPAPAVPERTSLVGIHPNPFNPTTTVDFELKESAWTTISIYNVSGQLVRVESLGTQPAGRHDWVWKGTDQKGNSVSSGVYFVVLRAGTVTDRRKAVLLK
jgi:FlgD Ig-like domain/Right handed beta helix region